MPLKTHTDEQPVLNLTPMIDVTFLIVIFFLVGTQFREDEKTIDVNLPQVAHAGPSTPAPEKKVVIVGENGVIRLDQQVVTVKQLTERLTAARVEYADLGVMVGGDAKSDFQGVADALSAIHAAGVTDMEIAVRVTEDEP